MAQCAMLTEKFSGRWVTFFRLPGTMRTLLNVSEKTSKIIGMHRKMSILILKVILIDSFVSEVRFLLV